VSVCVAAQIQLVLQSFVVLGCKKFVASSSRGPCFAGKMVVDTRYYEILQIKTDADELTIKKVCPMAFSFAGEAMNSC